MMKPYQPSEKKVLMPVLVDSSVWIAASSPRNKECMQLKRLIRNDEKIFLIDLIQLEVCQGAKTEEQFQNLWDSFLGFSFFAVEKKHIGLSAYHYFRCRKKGITPGTIDCLVGTMALDYKVPLWTLDQNLIKAAKLMKCELFRP